MLKCDQKTLKLFLKKTVNYHPLKPHIIMNKKQNYHRRQCFSIHKNFQNYCQYTQRTQKRTMRPQQVKKKKKKGIFRSEVENSQAGEMQTFSKHNGHFKGPSEHGIACIHCQKHPTIHSSFSIPSSLQSGSQRPTTHTTATCATPAVPSGPEPCRMWGVGEHENTGIGQGHVACTQEADRAWNLLHQLKLWNPAAFLLAGIISSSTSLFLSTCLS